MTKMMVPRHRIPKVSVLCPKCRHGTRIISATAFSDGYHRRHICHDGTCGHAFYTLAPYDGTSAKQSPLPFRDRPLSDAEVDTRLQWWTETAGEPITPQPVTPQGNTIDPFVRRLDDALKKEAADRTAADTYMVTVIAALKTKVAQLDQAKEKADA